MLDVVTIGPVIPVGNLARSVAFYEPDLGLPGWPLVSSETADLDALVADLAGRGVTDDVVRSRPPQRRRGARVAHSRSR